MIFGVTPSLPLHTAASLSLYSTPWLHIRCDKSSLVTTSDHTTDFEANTSHADYQIQLDSDTGKIRMGDEITIASDGGSLPANLSAGTYYCFSRAYSGGKSHLKLSATYADVHNGTYIEIGSTGTGTITKSRVTQIDCDATDKTLSASSTSYLTANTSQGFFGGGAGDYEYEIASDVASATSFAPVEMPNGAAPASRVLFRTPAPHMQGRKPSVSGGYVNFRFAGRSADLYSAISDGETALIVARANTSARHKTFSLDNADDTWTSTSEFGDSIGATILDDADTLTLSGSFRLALRELIIMEGAATTAQINNVSQVLASRWSDYDHTALT